MESSQSPQITQEEIDKYPQSPTDIFVADDQTTGGAE